MLKEFIKEYKDYYEISFDDGFDGAFERFYASICEPKFHPSLELVNKLNSLSKLLQEPLNIAVVGQFSSGKSSFLNAVLGDDILPTGIIPVTAKPSFIKYAPNIMLKALYNDDREEFLSINELGGFVDQRNNIKAVKSLNIYAPNEILKKVSFIDTPGLNSRSDSDTKETLNIIKQASGLIWISLIDNAARSSELEELKLIPKELKNTAICLLNQKDKLSQDEINRVLEHAKFTYDDYFSDVFAISAKMQRNNQENSGFESVFEFINQISSKKQDFIVQNCQNIATSLKAQSQRAIAILDELSEIFIDFGAKSNAKFDELKQIYQKDFKLLFETLKQNANLIANEINSNLINEQKEYFKLKKSAFNKENYEKITYERIGLRSDEALSKLIYNDDKMSKIFKKFRLDLNNLNAKIRADIDEIYLELKTATLAYKAKFQSLRKSDPLHSDVLFADIRKFSSEVYALFLGGFEQSLAEKYANLGLFIEKTTIKIATNYENAIKLSIHFIKDKIEKATDDFESDPSAFGLYFPQLKEINERVLKELSYYEFENDFVGSRVFSDKFIDALKVDFENLKTANLSYIEALKQKHKSNLDQIQTIISNLENDLKK